MLLLGVPSLMEASGRSLSVDSTKSLSKRTGYIHSPTNKVRVPGLHILTPFGAIGLCHFSSAGVRSTLVRPRVTDEAENFSTGLLTCPLSKQCLIKLVPHFLLLCRHYHHRGETLYLTY